ncbi:MAG: type 4a pilus biogenesis protein PilO [Patescibacteria group bacterium]|nr:type 4a pilus biogenesis protein PilO [Patescibacteria group bacterium]
MNLDWKKEYYRYHRYYFDLKNVTKTPKVRSFTWISLTLFTVCFFVIVAIKPTLVTIAKLEKEINDKKEANELLETKISSLIAAQKEYAQEYPNLKLLEEAFPEKNYFPKFASFLEEIAEEKQLIIQSLNFEKIDASLNPSPSAGKTEEKYFNFSVTVGGEYQQLKDFAKDLASSRRLIKIERTSFNQNPSTEEKEEDENIPKISLSIVGQVFFSN